MNRGAALVPLVLLVVCGCSHPTVNQPAPPVSGTWIGVAQQEVGGGPAWTLRDSVRLTLSSGRTLLELRAIPSGVWRPESLLAAGDRGFEMGTCTRTVELHFGAAADSVDPLTVWWGGPCQSDPLAVFGVLWAGEPDSIGRADLMRQ